MKAYSSRYGAALALAARAHRCQTRKGSDIPYVVHPVHVSVMLLRHGFEEDVVLAGLLHDVVEDQDVPLARIEAEFGPAVAVMVAVVSEKKTEGGVPRPWEDRKRETLRRLPDAPLGAVAIKAADVLHNARSLASHLREAGPAAWDHYSRSAAESMWYYGGIAEIARARLGPHPLVDEMNEAIRDLQHAIAEQEGPPGA